MNNIEKQDVIKSKVAYLNKIINLKNKYEYIVIYGAGKIAKPIYELINKENIEISAFCVTDKSVNKSQEYGIRIIQIDQMNLNRNKTLILIGVKEKWNREVIQKLDECGYYNYIEVPKYAEFFNEEALGIIERPVMEITTKIGCSINCRYCPQEVLCKNYYANNRDNNMTFETFKKCIDKTPENLIVDFAGFVEPFLNDECKKMILYANEKGRSISLYTTLVGMTKEIFESIKHIPFYEVVLHTPDEDEYANIPMTKEYFEVLDLVINAKKPDGTAFIDRANCQSSPHSEVLKHTNGKIRIFSELTDRAGNLNDENLFIGSDVLGKIYCNRAKNLNHNILLPDGTVVLCCMDFGMKHILGNLMHDSYEEIMNGVEMRHIKECMLNDNSKSILCRSCSSATQINR